MTDAKIAQYREKLSQMLNALHQERALGDAGTKTVALDQQSVGRLSRMDAMQQQAMAKATQTRRAGQEARIHAAIARIDEGEFGYCDTCGDDIPAARLALDPTARICIGCARAARG